VAYSVRFTGISKKDGSKLLRIEPSWWRVGEVTKLLDCDWVVSNRTGSYFDDDADISFDQARALHQHFAPTVLELIAINEDCIRAEKLRSDQYAALRLADYEKYVAKLKAEFDSIAVAVNEDGKLFSHFHVCIFEWESGF
jgi:hypothetical protein